MMQEELYDVSFKEQFIKNYKNNIEDIRNNISTHNNYLKIEKYHLTLDDILEKRKNSSYLNGLGFEYIENGIRILRPSKEFWDDIKEYISKNIKNLEVPFSLIKEDLSFFKNFSNLNTLIINDNTTLFENDIKSIYENTNIREIYTNSLLTMIDSYYKEKYFAVSYYPYNNVIYKELFLKPIDKIIEQEDENTVYNPFNFLRIYSYDLNEERINTLYDLNKERLKKEIQINTKEDNEYIIRFKDEYTIESIYITSNNINDANKFYNYLTNKGYKINNIYINTVDINYYDIDIYICKQLSKNTNLYFNYANYNTASYEEFKGLIESLKWYRQIIIESNLSPVEKLMYAFDIMKTFAYKESITDESDSREPHRVIETGNIVCVGYAYLLNQILKDLDNNINISNFVVHCYDKNNNYLGDHQRNIVKLDDEKYNINGVYVVDATWDSLNDEIKNKIDNEYTALDLYRYFLVPLKDYKKIFQNDSLPQLFKEYERYNDQIKETNELNKMINDLLERKKQSQLSIEYYCLFNKNIKEEEIRKYIDVKRPSLELFNDILYNVRLKEGYLPIEAKIEVEKVNRINNKIINNMNYNGIPIEYFKEEKGISK